MGHFYTAAYRSGAAFEAPALVAGLDDVAVMCEAVESAVAILGSPNTVGHSPKARCARRDGSSEQVTELVEDDEVAAGELLGGVSLSTGAGFGLEVVDQLDNVIAAAAGAISDAGART